MATDVEKSIQSQIQAAAQHGRPLCIAGGRSKPFLGNPCSGEVLDVSRHQGIVNYQPTELVLTARAGTPLRLIEHALGENNQMLGFEPPHFGDGATLGGTIACGLSGPRRPFSGAARDFVLGTRIINGRGEVLRFGGEVMKNVAGYDVSRLMCGAFGTLGVLLEVSVKVLPRPAAQVTLSHETTEADAIRTLAQWSRQPYPISATCFDGDRLFIRLSGAESGVRSAQRHLGGEVEEDGEAFWQRLREHSHGFFRTQLPLWRLSLPPTTPPLHLEGKQLLEWNGAQRWLRSAADAAVIRRAAAAAAGHATRFRGGDGGGAFQPLPETLLALHRRLKQAFDPFNLFNREKLYAEL